MEWKSASPREIQVEGPSFIDPNFLWNYSYEAMESFKIYMLYHGHSTQTKPKTQTTKLDNVFMLFVTRHEKILNKCYWAPNKNSYVGSCLNYFQKENLIKIIL